MDFSGYTSAHIDHKYPTFDYLHQGFQVFHFEIHSEVLVFEKKFGRFGYFRPILAIST